MKYSIIILSILILSGVALAYWPYGGTYEKANDWITIDAKAGWNLVPLLYSNSGNQFYSLAALNEGACPGAFGSNHSWFYYPKYNKYVYWDEMKNLGKGEYINDSSSDNEFELDASTGKYIHTNNGAIFVYFFKDCVTKIPNVSTNTTEIKKVNKGWNFITLMPWMENKKIRDNFNECNIVNINAWNGIEQKWEITKENQQTALAQFKDTAVTSNMLGSVYLLKFENTCELSASVVGPSELPN